MKIDWGVNPAWMRIGLLVLTTGVILDGWLLFHRQDVPWPVGLLIGGYLGLGSFIVANQIGTTRRIRRAARDWAEKHPYEDTAEVTDLAERREVARQREAKLQALREEQRRAMARLTEDSPEWAQYARAQRKPPKPPKPPSEGEGGS